jgi:phytoene dehydrogenase-like protein
MKPPLGRVRVPVRVPVPTPRAGRGDARSTFSRREALALLLGAPLAADACRLLPKRRFDGANRGAAAEVGHRIRHADATVEKASGNGAPTRVDIAIVGAGPSGLSAAWRLERLGERGYTVFDLEAQAGGTSAYGTDGVVPYPWGAHYVPLPSADNRALVELLREIGAIESVETDGDGRAVVRASERALVREPEERLFIDGAWRQGLYPFFGASADDLRELGRFAKQIDEWVGAFDAAGRRAFTVPLHRCSTDSRFTELDRISAASFLARAGYRSPRLRWYVEYACRDDYGLPLDETSAWAMAFYFAARVRSPGGAGAPFVTFPEGNGRLVRHLTGAIGDRLALGRLVTDVVPGEDHVELAVLDVPSGALRRVIAGHVILAVPRFVALRLLRPFREAPPPQSSAFTTSPWMVANLHLRARPPSDGFPFAWDNVLYDSPSLGYVVATHQRLADTGPTVWTYYHPFVDRDPADARRRLFSLDHDALVDGVIADLGRAHPGLEDFVTRVDTWKWGHAMVRPVPGFIWGEARRRAAEPLGRVHFAHTDLSGLALFEEAQHHGVRAAEAVLVARGRTIASLI